MSVPRLKNPPVNHARFIPVAIGVSLFFGFQFAVALWRLAHSSTGMENKFSALAREKHLGFLIGENLRMLIAYGLLVFLASFLIQPLVSWWTGRSKCRKNRAIVLRSVLLIGLVHGYCTLRLVDTRPYFLTEAEFGHWYYQALNLIPAFAKPACNLLLFSVLPIVFILLAARWQIRRQGRRGWITAGAVVALAALFFGIGHFTRETTVASTSQNAPPNILILGSDSLRADRLGCSGYRPNRTDGPAAAGVSPAIDAFAKDSVRFENCYTSIASTMESGTSLMASQYPHTHGIRQMYPDRETVEEAKSRIVPMARLMRERGYDTAAIGDWCAGYYQVMPLDFEHVSVSDFDTFKIYMSQAVVMAHFVVPLYFDNALGYRIFPQLESFAQFVTPEVVTRRVEDRLAKVAKKGTPFFWHVFYSCNHLPCRSPEAYRGLFGDPAYEGKNRNGVSFDIDSFIGGTDLESKWEALPPKEIRQIRALYDGCTRQFDDCVKRVLESLDRNGLSKNTIVIVTSDHGDDQYEPGVTLSHGQSFNGGMQSNHVPMIVRVPGVAPRVIPETVRLIDVMPTLADLAGVEKPVEWEGRSFADWLHGTRAPEWRPFYGETSFPFVQFQVPGVERPKLPPMDEMTRIDDTFNYQFVLKEEWRERVIQAKQRCLKTRYWKLVCTPTAQGGRHFALFQLHRDPYGETDLAASRPEVLAPMRAALERWIDHHAESSVAEIFPADEPE